jgi:hypothetical protein
MGPTCRSIGPSPTTFAAETNLWIRPQLTFTPAAPVVPVAGLTPDRTLYLRTPNGEPINWPPSEDIARASDADRAQWGPGWLQITSWTSWTAAGRRAARGFVADLTWNTVPPSTGRGYSTLVTSKPAEWSRPCSRTPTATPGTSLSRISCWICSPSSARTGSVTGEVGLTLRNRWRTNQLSACRPGDY